MVIYNTTKWYCCLKRKYTPEERTQKCIAEPHTQSILTCYLISLALALLSKTTHENIGFEKLQFINP